MAASTTTNLVQGMVCFTLLVLSSTTTVHSVQEGKITEDTISMDIDVGRLQKKFAHLRLVLGISVGVLALTVVVLIFFLYLACSHSQQVTLPAAPSVTAPQGVVEMEMPPSTSSMVPAQSVDPAVIDIFPLNTFPCEGNITYGVCCSICIEEFVDGESLCSFPNCGHLYHSKCIKEWLTANRGTWCPYCKCNLVV